ncbi:hypothetical protein C1H46_024744 [Malus baccata]|uniref:Gnk2-homologous domain-containing protein n=1 Tax=Malus baccata TaxID=106549 RepID=A0A540LTB4_MALBA|nr:hypothetical protein C1H46_024744 [Malus baccata]
MRPRRQREMVGLEWRSCLEKGSKAAMGCAPSKEGRALNAECYLRYSTEKFYNDAGGAEQVADHGHGNL